jgi:hypothetical protein
MLPAAVANVLRSTATNAALLITLPQPVRSPLSRCHRRKKQNPRPTRPVGSVVLAKFADSLAPLASPRRAPGANRGLSSFCIRSRPSSRGSLGVRTVKANPPPSRRKSTTRQQQPWSAAGRCRTRRLRGVNQNHWLTRQRSTRLAGPAKWQIQPFVPPARRARHTRRLRGVSQKPPVIAGRCHGLRFRRRCPQSKKRFRVAHHFARQKSAGRRNAAPAGQIHPTRAALAPRPLALRQIAPRRPPVHPPKAAGSRKGKSACIQNLPAALARAAPSQQPASRKKNASPAASGRSSSAEAARTDPAGRTVPVEE